MVTSLMEVLKLQNFGHMTKSIIKFDLWDKFLLITSQKEAMMS